MKFRIVLVLVTCFLFYNLNVKAQRWKYSEQKIDTIHFRSSQILVTKNELYFSSTDSFIVFPKKTRYRIRKNPYAKSKAFYDSLQVKSYRNRITSELHRLFFRTVPIEVQDTSNFSKSESVFKKIHGKQIRKIRLKKVPIISGSIYDTLLVPKSSFAKWANRTHINSRNRVIYNNLTFKEGDLVDQFELAANERIIRGSNYIEDARIYVIPVLGNTNEVDLLIVSKDDFSIGIGGDYNKIDNFKLTLSEKNFLGIGHEMQHSIIYNSSQVPQYGYGFQYGVNNISNSFISANVEYENSWDKELVLLNFNKPFLTQQTKFAGSLSLYEIADKKEFKREDSTTLTPYRTTIQDAWLGRAFPISKSSRTTINISVRYARTSFKKRPIVTEDTNFFFHNRSLILASVSLIKRNYYKSSLVLGFGLTEDIPYGYIISAIAGFEKNQFTNKPYLGGDIAFGKYFDFPGYLLINGSIGAFYNKGNIQDGVLSLKLRNIGKLHQKNRYSIRNFTTISFQSGINLSDPESKTILNNRWTSMVSGLNKEALKGKQKLSLNYENVLFTPWYFAGFKFALFSFVDLGWVWQNNNTVKHTPFYASIGGGLRLKNESWIFETITLGFAYFASAPTGSNNMGFLLDASDPRLFEHLLPGKPKNIEMDQSPSLFLH